MRANVRAVALGLLSSYEREGRFVNLLLNSAEARSLSADERAFLCTLLYTTVENKLKYDYFISAFAKRGISEIDPEVRDIIRLGMCQIFELDSIPDFAAVSETVSLCKRRSATGFVNAVLRRAVENKDNPPYPDRAKNLLRYLSVKYSMPLPLLRHYSKLIPDEELESLLQVLTAQAPLSLTANTERASRDELIRELEYLDAKPSKYTDKGIIVCKNTAISDILAFSSGKVFAQDEASRIAVEALGLKNGESVADVCSAPGGKSFLASTFVGEEGRIYSFELHESKLSLIKEGACRLGLTNITVGARDARYPAPELLGKLDALIVDAPCSGLGVIAKKPDLRYKELSSIEELPALQYSILENSSAYLKSGGRLLYSTCTLNPAENEGVTDRFIAEHPEFCYEDFSVGGLDSESGRLTLYPHRHNTDGFYISLIRKK